MFYSQCFLSKSGPLAAIWVAGCCFKRLKKRQVTDTNIISSVDQILLEGLPSATYRILALLLLGVVRIYSRKVEYLFQDCHETVSDINRFSVEKKVTSFRDLVRPSHSIELPETYELDTFQLEVGDGASSGNIARSEDIVLRDVRTNASELYSLDKNSFDNEISSHLEETCNAETSSRAGVHLETCLSIQTPDKVAANKETSTNAYTPPDEVLSPHRMDSPDHIKTFQASKEKLRELRFTQEDGMDVDMICELDDELLNLINEYQLQKVDDGDGDNLEKVPLEEHDHVLLVDKEVPSTVEKTFNSDVPDNASTVEKTSNLYGPDNAGGDEVLFSNNITPSMGPAATSPGRSRCATGREFLVPTPSKESFQRPNKRKCIIDESLVLDNQAMKQAINDASDLVCKRRKSPHTVIDIWRFLHIPILSNNILDPMIPCAAALERTQHAHHCEKIQKSKPSSSAAAEPLQTIEAIRKPQEIISPWSPSDSRLTIAPGTPVRCSTLARVLESPRAADSDEDPVHLYENARKEPYVHEDEEDHCPILTDETEADEGDSQELDKNKNGLSSRTRTVASYLHKVMAKKKQQGEESVSLLPVLEHRTRAENSRLFFEVLVLTSRGLVKVLQEKAYDDVILEETPKMEKALGSC